MKTTNVFDGRTDSLFADPTMPALFHQFGMDVVSWSSMDPIISFPSVYYPSGRINLTGATWQKRRLPDPINLAVGASNSVVDNMWVVSWTVSTLEIEFGPGSVFNITIENQFAPCGHPHWSYREQVDHAPGDWQMVVGTSAKIELYHGSPRRYEILITGISDCGGDLIFTTTRKK